MAETQALADLRDIHVPDPIGWWPLALGWYGVTLIILLLLFAFVYFMLRRFRCQRAKKQAFLLLTAYEREYEAHGDAPVISARISGLLRRVALVYFPRESVAGLHGERWIDFLNNTSQNINFSVLSDCLLVLPYQNNATEVDLLPLFKSVKAWIKQRGEHV